MATNLRRHAVIFILQVFVYTVQAKHVTVDCSERLEAHNITYDAIMAKSLQAAILQAEDGDVIVLADDANCTTAELVNDTLLVTGRVTIRTSDNIENTESLIGFTDDPVKILYILFGDSANVTFVNVRFVRVAFDVQINQNVSVTWSKCTFDDSRLQANKNVSHAFMSIKDSVWRNVNSSWLSEFLLAAHTVHVVFDNVQFLQTNVTIYSSHLASILITRCVMHNHLPDSHNFGVLYITIMNHLQPSTVTIRHSTFINKTLTAPVDSIMNLYEAAVRVRGTNPRTKQPISFVSVLIDSCHFAHNERGLTFSGGFQSVVVSNCVFEDNVAMHAGAGILFLNDPMLPSALVTNCAFLRNKAGYTRHDLEPYKESIQMQGDDVRIQSPCCKGIISLVGKGGAVRVQTGHVTFDSCTFVNNSARLLGGAIFVDRGPNIPDRSVKENLNKVIIANTKLANHVPSNATQGSLLYSNGMVTIQSAELETTVARDHTTILSHSSDHWTIEVVNITIVCPVGYRVRMTNASTYGVEPAVGLRRSYMLDQLSYACESCPRHKYSLDRGFIRSRRVYDNANDKIHFVFMINGKDPDDGITGSYIHHDVTCLQCPYGGRCGQGEGITAVANFWGYQTGNQIRFQHCPKGYCCTLPKCLSYNTCAAHRDGRLCSRCRQGYSEAFFSSKCLPDSDCNPLLLAAYGAFSGIVYSLFLLFQKDIRELMFFHSILARGQRLSPPNKGKEEKKERHNYRKNGSESLSTAAAEGDAGKKSCSILQQEPHASASEIGHQGNGLILALPGNGQALPTTDDSSATSSLIRRNKKHPTNNQNGNNGAPVSASSASRPATPASPAADAGASFIIILFFYFQDVQLLHVKTVFAKDEVADIGKLRTFLAGIFKFQVDIFQFFEDMCMLPGTTPVMKVLIMTGLVPLVICIFAVLFCVYKCLAQQEASTSQLVSNASSTPPTDLSMKEYFLTRIATGFSLALLFTYQNLASAALTLLNCVPVNDTSVLYIDGDVECYQPWQYGIMAYTIVAVLPFCAVIFYGPGLLRDCLISLPHFFCACVLPLPFLLAWICLRLCLNGRKPPNAGQAPFEVKAVMQILQGPFKDAQTRLLGPTCGQGIVLGRRLILILLFTFVNDSLMRMLCMNLFCFVMLLHHVHVLPYKDRRGNFAGSASASALVIVAGINLVRAAFEAAEYLPRGPYEMLVLIFDHVENVLVLWLPAAIMALVVVSLTIRLLCGRVIAAAVRCCCKTAGVDDEANQGIEVTPL